MRLIQRGGVTLAVLFLVGLAVPRTASAQAQPAGMSFNGDAAMISWVVKGDKVADFEEVLTKLREGLAKSATDSRKQMGASLKMFKSTTPLPNNNALFVWFMDPVVKDADYNDAFQSITEAFGNDAARDVFAKLRDSLAGRTPLTLTALK